MDYLKLSKEVSYALRHAPWEYELELDDDGWVEIDLLIKSLKLSKEWHNLTKIDLEKMIVKSDKIRHEIMQTKIRALYGHSLPHKICKEIKLPPAKLYHGTALTNYDSIMNYGLVPMNRQYVHLSSDIDTAKTVAIRHSSKYVIFIIETMPAINNGVVFYYGNEKVWLVDSIAPEYLSVLSGQ